MHRIIQEIVDEGEGATRFEEHAEEFLAKVKKTGGVRAYLKLKLSSDPPRPKWIDEGEILRNSHLYRFAMIMLEMQQESALAAEVGLTFASSRQPINIEGNASLQKLTQELPGQFNACYLALHVWLSRMYEIPNWKEDKPERAAIEMLSSWPMMSIAIRPFLELATFFPIELRNLFRPEKDAVTPLPLYARELYELYKNPERAEPITDRMDYLVVRVLASTAAWATDQRETIRTTQLPQHMRDMILARLDSLSTLLTPA